MLFNIYVVLLSSRRFWLSILITGMFMIVFYVLFLESTYSSTVETDFFGAALVTLPSLVFYLFYYNKLFRIGYFRFLRLNLHIKQYFKYIWRLIVGVSLILAFWSLLIYFGTNLAILREVHFNSILYKDIAYLCLLQFFLSSLSFVISAYSVNFWLLIISVFYFSIEDTIVLYLKTEDLEQIGNLLPSRTFFNAFRMPWSWGYALPLLYIGLIILVIQKKNYIRI